MASTPLVHEARYRVRFDEAGPDGRLRTSGLMRYAQDVAWQHSTALGFGRDWYLERGLTWLVRSAELEVLAPIAMGGNVVAETTVSASAASGPAAAASSTTRRGRS
jgi:acyl-ACP thioesterase